MPLSFTSADEIQQEIDRHLAVLSTLREESGLFIAAAREGVKTGYDKAWLRDNFYISLAFEETGDMETVRTLWHAILDVFLKHEYKIDWALRERPRYTYQYIHARYHPESFEEYWEEWGNKQNDAIGAILFAIGSLEKRGVSLLRGEDDTRIIGRLVAYLGTLEYWHDPDNGVWEEYEEVHSSSISACVAGLKAVRDAGLVAVDEALIQEGEKALRALLPRESESKFTDLALLSLIYPYRLLTEEETKEIVRHLSYHLPRARGIIRYKNDRYYNKNNDGYSEEAEWTMGFPWLSIIYRGENLHEEADQWLLKTREVISARGELPELYFSDSENPNENTPLGWAESMYIVALKKTKDFLSRENHAR